MMSALGQCREAGQDRLFVKFDAWNVLPDPAHSRRLFPEVPSVFIYLPVEVMVSSDAAARPSHHSHRDGPPPFSE